MRSIIREKVAGVFTSPNGILFHMKMPPKYHTPMKIPPVLGTFLSLPPPPPPPVKPQTPYHTDKSNSEDDDDDDDKASPRAATLKATQQLQDMSKKKGGAWISKN